MRIPEPIYQEIIACLPILCVDLLIIHNGKCLLLKRSNHPAFGQLWFPGGRVRKYEKLSEAALRIALEETGVSCRFEGVISVEETIFLKSEGEPIDKHTVNVCCRLAPLNDPQNVTLDHLHEAYEWVVETRSELHEAVRHPMELAGFRSA